MSLNERRDRLFCLTWLMYSALCIYYCDFSVVMWTVMNEWLGRTRTVGVLLPIKVYICFRENHMALESSIGLMKI